jgi:hypothetical protein
MNSELVKKLLALPDVKLAAVTKKHTREEVDALHALGVTTFAENRVQEFLEKYNPDYDWHIIGHLQTNKVKYVVGKVSLIESVDSLRLAKEIQKQAQKLGIVQDVLAEVRISKMDENKTGLPPEELDALLLEMDKMPNIRVRGLMTIASNTDDQNVVAGEFKAVRKMFDDAAKLYPSMDICSMGMSSDYECAIENGANQIRVGSALFS